MKIIDQKGHSYSTLFLINIFKNKQLGLFSSGNFLRVIWDGELNNFGKIT